jgi:Cys-rich radical ribosomally synthesized peptide
MSGKETDYAKLWGKIKDGAYTMAKCNCIACNGGCHPSCRHAPEWEDIQW